MSPEHLRLSIVAERFWRAGMGVSRRGRWLEVMKRPLLEAKVVMDAGGKEEVLKKEKSALREIGNADLARIDRAVVAGRSPAIVGVIEAH